MKRITKVKYKAPAVEIHFEETAKSATKESIFKSVEKPHPDLELAFAGLVRHVYEILEIPVNSWKNGINVTGASFSKSEDSGVEGAVITCQAPLDDCQSPFCFNTPHMPFEPYSEGSEAPTMDADCVQQLELVRKEADLYMGGKRAQQELDLAPAETDGKAAASGTEPS